jgi:hypothetical protein
MKSRTATNHSSSIPEWLPLLAAAVVHQALSDVLDPSLPPAVRRDARRFLAGSAEYRLWGRVAEDRGSH